MPDETELHAADRAVVDRGRAAPLHRIGDIIERAPFGSLHKSAIALCCLAGIFKGLDAQRIGFLAPSIADTLHVDVRSLSPMFSASFFGLMLGTLILGPLSDGWGGNALPSPQPSCSACSLMTQFGQHHMTVHFKEFCSCGLYPLQLTISNNTA